MKKKLFTFALFVLLAVVAIVGSYYTMQLSAVEATTVYANTITVNIIRPAHSNRAAVDNGSAYPDACRTYYAWAPMGGIESVNGTECAADVVVPTQVHKKNIVEITLQVTEAIIDMITNTPAPTDISTTATPEIVATSTPNPTQIVATETPDPIVVATKAHCDKGKGNGSEGCDPGNNPNTGNDDENGAVYGVDNNIDGNKKTK